MATALLCFGINAFANSLLPLLNRIALVWSLLGFAVISIAVLATAAPDFHSPSYVFGGVTNLSTWPTGLAWMIGLLQGTLSSASPSPPPSLLLSLSH